MEDGDGGEVVFGCGEGSRRGGWGGGRRGEEMAEGEEDVGERYLRGGERGRGGRDATEERGQHRFCFGAEEFRAARNELRRGGRDGDLRVGGRACCSRGRRMTSEVAEGRMGPAQVSTAGQRAGTATG